MQLLKKILPFVLVAAIFFVTGQIFKKDDGSAMKGLILGEEKCDFKFINPLRCEHALISPRTELVPLREKLDAYIAKAKADGIISGTGIYFRDLHNGPILNINELEKFTPASLLKVPVMITYLKLAESDPTLLQKEIGHNFVPDTSEDNAYGDQTIEPKTAYKIEHLIYKMIVYSDNRSKNLLLSHLPEIENDYDPFLRTISDLGIIADTENINTDFLSVKAYSSIFRNLYNASYLNSEMSEKALEILSQSSFKEGLVAGVPSDIKVAHKFGDRNATDGKLQRHDCGIIYYDENHYSLCVMTRGKDLNKMNGFIQNVSAMFYEEIRKSH